jgi:hypothetical protein
LDRGGIKVRGHWVIDVREPDGAEVARRESAQAEGGRQ